MFGYGGDVEAVAKARRELELAHNRRPFCLFSSSFCSDGVYYCILSRISVINLILWELFPVVKY
jgi:hypothetical protein